MSLISTPEPRLKRIRTVNGHTALARVMVEMTEDPVGWIPRQQDIPSPYASSPTHAVWGWRGRKVIMVETRHARTEIYDVPREMVKATEEECI